MELFEDPKGFYSGFSKSIAQELDEDNFNVIERRLLQFNHEINARPANKINDDTCMIDEIVNQGMVEMVFVKMISHVEAESMFNPSITKSLKILLETITNLINVSDTAKSKASIFLPHLMRDLVGKADNECSLRIDAAKLVNTLVENDDSSSIDQINDMKRQKCIREDIGVLLSNVGDFELQALILEIVFRIIPTTERASYLRSWFHCEELKQLFLSIEDRYFEPGCRRFLNKLNSINNEKRVYSVPCQTVFFGNEKVSVAKDTGSNKCWVDLNLGSGTLKFFVDEKDNQEDVETWWHTVSINSANVSSCIFIDTQYFGPTIKLTLKDDAGKLVPSLPERGDRCVFIRLALDSRYEQQMVREIFQKMEWIKTEFLSPKSSVAISVVHVANRQKGMMKILPSITSMPPNALMEEDDHDSDYPSSITGQSQDALSQPISQTSSQNPDSQEHGNIAPKKQGQVLSKDKEQSLTNIEKEKNHEKLNGKDDVNHKDLRSKGRQSISPQSEDRINNACIDSSKKKADALVKEQGSHSSEEKDSKKNNISRKKRSGNKSSDKDSGRESSSSSGSGRGRARSKTAKSPRPKKAKSPLAVAIRKGKANSKSSTSTTTDEDKESKSKVNGAKKSAFDIAKEIPKDTAKTYPKAFNVAQRMQALKCNATSLSSSQKLTKKVFGHKGKCFFKEGEEKGRQSQRSIPSAKLSSSEDDVAERQSKTMSNCQSKADELETMERSSDKSSMTNNYGSDDDQIEVIQDSLPLDNSPERIYRPKSDIPRGHRCRKALEERLVKSTSSKQKTKKHSFFEHVPARLGTILRKGGADANSSLLKQENPDGGSSSSTSRTSTESDWPGPLSEPGPKPKHSLVPRVSIRETRGARSRANRKEKTAKKRTFVSPVLSDITEERTPKDAKNDDKQDSPEDNSSRKLENSLDKGKSLLREEDRINKVLHTNDTVSNKTGHPKYQEDTNQDNSETFEDFQFDLPDLKVECSCNDNGSFPGNDSIDTVKFVDETSLEHGTFTKHNHTRKDTESSNDTHDEDDSRGLARRKYCQISNEKRPTPLGSDGDSDDEINDLYNMYDAPKRRNHGNSCKKATADGNKANSEKNTSDEEEEDTLYGKYSSPKRTATYTSNKNKHKESKPIKMPSPPRAEKRKKFRKATTPISSKKRLNQDLSDSGDNEAIKLRRFCESISSRKLTSTPAAKKFDELMEDYSKAKEFEDNDLEHESPGYSDVETEQSTECQKQANIGKEKMFKTKGNETHRPNPSLAPVTTNERFGRRLANNPSKWETPEQRRLDDSGIGTGSRESFFKSKKARTKGELSVTRSISKTPNTPRTSAIMKRFGKEQTNEQNVEKSKRKSYKLVDYTSSGPSKQRQYIPQNDAEDVEEESQNYVQRVPKRPKEKAKSFHNPQIIPRKLFKDQHVSFSTFNAQIEENDRYKSSDDSVVGDITNIMSDLEGVLNDRLRRKRNHLQRFCKKTFDVTLQTVSNHLEQSLASRDQLVDAFNDQFLDEMNTLKDEIEKTKKSEQEIMTRIQEDMKVLKTARVIQEKKVKSLQSMCMEFQNDLIMDSKSNPEKQGALQDNIRQELVNIQRDFMREAQSQDRENLRRSLRSVLDVTMM